MNQNSEIITRAIKNCLALIEQDREREILMRRFGLKGHRETLEQIGDLLSITRERVRQLEKAILIRLRIRSEEGTIDGLAAAEKIIVRHLSESGRIARIEDLATKISGHPATEAEISALTLISHISHSLTYLDGNDRYHTAIGIAEYGDRATITKEVDEIVATIKKINHPVTIEDLDAELDYEHPSYIAALANISKQLSNLGNLWGLNRWPTVNPKNIRDKIFVVLTAKGEPMHFSAIAKAIAESNFRRKNVTQQAIHNELIKDPRFILIGRGIYALDTWGYRSGTVSEIIVDILKEAGKPLSREEIVKAVLNARRVKTTTILLNLQDKNLFKKIDSDHYTLAQ